MYLGGSTHVHVVRHRDDHRRARSRCRVADGPAGDPRLAGRPGREGRRPDHQEPAVERGRAACGRGSSTRSSGIPSSRWWPRQACCVVLAIPALQHPHGDRGRRHAAAGPEVIKTYNKIQAAFPVGPIPAVVAVSADDVTTPEVSGAVADLQHAGCREPDVQAADHDATSAPIARSREVDIPLAGDGTDSQSNAPRRAARQADSRDDRAGPGRHGRRDRPHRRLEGLQRHAEVARAAASSRSSSRRRSCCCWSPSARS